MAVPGSSSFFAEQFAAPLANLRKLALEFLEVGNLRALIQIWMKVINAIVIGTHVWLWAPSAIRFCTHDTYYGPTFRWRVPHRGDRYG